MQDWSLDDARNKFSQLLNAALTGEPQKFLDQGQRAVVILAAQEYDRLRKLDESQVPSFSELLLEIPQDDQDFDRSSIRPRAVDD